MRLDAGGCRRRICILASLKAGGKIQCTKVYLRSFAPWLRNWMPDDAQTNLLTWSKPATNWYAHEAMSRDANCREATSRFSGSAQNELGLSLQHSGNADRRGGRFSPGRAAATWIIPRRIAI